MLTDGVNNAVAIGATTNIIAGRPLEFLGAPSVVRLLLVSDLPSASAQWLINVGGVQLAPLAAGMPVNVATAPGGGPRDDEDTVAAGVAVPAGARSQLNITNANAAINNTRYRAYIGP
jgi:hypothetical protein